MISRRKAILRLIQNEGGTVSKLRLFKLAFLLRQRSRDVAGTGVYDFIPYLHGPYSFTLSYDLRSLERDGWVRALDSDVRPMRDFSSEVPEKNLCREIDELSKEYRWVPTEALVSEVYRLFPWYTANAKDEARRGAAIPESPCAVYTVGYEGLMLDGLLDLLLRSGIKHLVDVRHNPVARRFGFHRSTLDRHCHEAGIRYTHVPELGIPSSWRVELDTTTTYEQLFKRYEREILPAQTEVVSAVAKYVTDEPSALMCMESDCRCCHRSRLARVVAGETGLSIRELRDE